MKIRNGFVSNSSATAFIITNTSDEVKTIVDFAKETPHLVEEFKKMYDWYNDDERFSQENVVAGAEQIVADEQEDMTFAPGESKECIFGDEQGTVIGHVYDYMLRECGGSESFKVEFSRWCR